MTELYIQRQNNQILLKKKDEELIKRINEDKKVCLECTKEKCYGGERCFLNMKNAKRAEK